MAKEVIKPTLAHSDRRRVTSAVCEALSSKENTGSIVTLVCNAARAIMKGKPFPDADMAAICEDVAKERGWKGPALKVRSSEVKTILTSYAKLPEAVALAQSKGPCNWHMAMKMARVLKNGKSVQTAVTEARKSGNGVGTTPEGRIAAALKTLFKEKKAKRSIYTKAWELLGLKGEIA